MMKKISLFLLSCLMGLSAYSQKLASTTQIPVQLNNELSSKDAPTTYNGAVVAADIKDLAGNVLIKAGTPIITNVTSKKARGVGKPGSLEIEYVSTKAVDGTLIKLTGKTTAEGENRQGKVLGVGLGVGLAVLLPMLAYLAKKGGQAVIPAGMYVSNVYTLGEYMINVQ